MFDDAIKLLVDYRTNRAAALNNEERMKWSTADVSSLSELVETFGTDQENADWKTAYEANDDVTVQQAHALKIAWMAGCRRDMRMLFVTGDDNRMRLPQDFDRFEYMRNFWARAKLEVFAQVIEAKLETSQGEG
jgi:hypothetical protein